MLEERFLYVHRAYVHKFDLVVGDKRMWSNAGKVSSCFKMVSESYVTLNTHVVISSVFAQGRTYVRNAWLSHNTVNP